MTRYYFHLNECGRYTADEEGRECPSYEAAVEMALEAARDVMAGELKAGKICIDCHIAITGGGEEELGRVNFRDAVKIVGRLS